MGSAMAALALAPGLALGSFLNVVAARVPLKRSLVRPGSSCMSCKAPDRLVRQHPGRLVLRCCAEVPELRCADRSRVSRRGDRGGRSSWRRCVLAFGLTFYAAIAAFFCCVLVAISAIDIEHRIVPDRIVLPSTLIVLAAQMVRDPSIEWPLAAFLAAFFLFVAAVIYPAGMGMGDVKLALLMGAALGKVVSVALIIGMVSAVIPGLYLLARHGRSARKMGVPFAPFLALGSVIALFAGEWLLEAYLGVLRS